MQTHSEVAFYTLRAGGGLTQQDITKDFKAATFQMPFTVMRTKEQSVLRCSYNHANTICSPRPHRMCQMFGIVDLRFNFHVCVDKGGFVLPAEKVCISDWTQKHLPQYVYLLVNVSDAFMLKVLCVLNM